MPIWLNKVGSFLFDIFLDHLNPIYPVPAGILTLASSFHLDTGDYIMDHL